MTRFHDSELSQRIDDTILAHLESGEPTADEVSHDVLNRYGDLIGQFGHDRIDPAAGRTGQMVRRGSQNPVTLRAFPEHHLPPVSPLVSGRLFVNRAFRSRSPPRANNLRSRRQPRPGTEAPARAACRAGAGRSRPGPARPCA